MPFLTFVVAVLISFSAHAEHATDASNGGRPTGEALQAKVKEIFSNKCQSCHYGDGKFTDDDLPTEEWKGKILGALNHKPGVRAMPPAAKDQLTPDEKKLINEWAGIEEESPAEDICGDTWSPPNANVVKQIFADRCVTCHGKLSWNPTSVLRPAHQQFLKNDGTFDLSVLGDMTEIEPYQMPAGKTSIPRMVDALSGYTMPPRGWLPVISTPSEKLLPKVGTPHMSGPERQYLITVLNQKMARENCSPKSFELVNFVQGKKPALAEYKLAAQTCADRGMHLPNRKQVEDARAKAAVKAEGCVWTNTFAFDEEHKDRALRKTLSFTKEGKSFIGWATENYTCQTLCVK